MKTQPIKKTIMEFSKNKIRNLQVIVGGDGDDDGTIERDKINVPPGG